MLLTLCVESLFGLLLRFWLVTSELKKEISDRVEVSTPLNSWKRVTEGVHLLTVDGGGGPYEGDLVHEPPLTLFIYKYLIEYTPHQLLFIVADLFTATLLYLTAKKYLNETFQRQQQQQNGKDVSSSSSSSTLFIINHNHLVSCPNYVFAVYLFNPFVVFNCVAMTTTVFNNLLLAIYIYTLVHKKLLLCCFALAFITMQTFYSFVFICPILLSTSMENDGRNKRTIKNSKYVVIYYYAVAFATCFCLLQYFSSLICGHWKFLDNTYGFILSIPDLQPNVGLFWYFFTEMFEHFRALFIAAFQINVTLLYLVPLTIRFRSNPTLLAFSFIALTTIFKSYPSVGDVGFFFSFIPMWMYLFHYLQQGFLVSCCLITTTVLAPIVWHLWIYSHSANANFYFGVTLSFATAQIFFITDLLFAYIKTEFWFNNHHLSDIDLETAKVKLTLE